MTSKLLLLLLFLVGPKKTHFSRQMEITKKGRTFLSLDKQLLGLLSRGKICYTFIHMSCIALLSNHYCYVIVHQLYNMYNHLSLLL